ncbi:hypothetical protein GOAMR_60_00190 [Gordonia amarae NBRC 15530]|uniref:Uncharacterized protein n=1 Tax=Gordonia amarae NBRC 15530 TaxID=1075090 RepID=G7GTG1_9ACTN|nr:hypothetical protein GOAMR_60_00190 [Gordonia amarae NBRC 15530]
MRIGLAMTGLGRAGLVVWTAPRRLPVLRVELGDRRRGWGRDRPAMRPRPVRGMLPGARLLGPRVALGRRLVPATGGGAVGREPGDHVRARAGRRHRGFGPSASLVRRFVPVHPTKSTHRDAVKPPMPPI